MNTRTLTSTDSDVRVYIPRDVAGGKREVRVERAVRWLWSHGLYPGPAAVSLRLHGHANRTINGVETKVRNRLMKELGIPRQRPGWFNSHFARVCGYAGEDDDLGGTKPSDPDDGVDE